LFKSIDEGASWNELLMIKKESQFAVITELHKINPRSLLLTMEVFLGQRAFNIYEVFDVGSDLVMSRAYQGLQPSGDYFIGLSNDQGVTWEKIPVPDYIQEFTFVTPSIGYGYERNVSSGLYKTTNGGDSWELIYPNVEIISTHYVDDQIAWISTSDGLVHYTIDGGSNFALGNCGKGRMFSITGTDQEVAYGVVDNSIFTFDLTATSDCQMVNANNIKPTASLQIHPNPARNTITLELLQKPFVDLSITNSLGQLVSNYTLRESLQNIDISNFLAGIYFLNILNEEKAIVETIKFVKIE